MTVKTKLSYKRAKRKFNMPLLRKRIKKRFRKTFKKSITSTEIDKIWSDYVDEKVNELLSNGKIEFTEGFTLEVVGRKILDNKVMVALLSKGLMLRGGRVQKAIMLNKRRPEISYKIEMKNKNFKDGELYFQAHSEIKKKLTNVLMNTDKYFKIV